MGDVLQALAAIRQLVDLLGNAQYFISHNAQAVFDALRVFVFRTGNPAVPGAPFTTVGPIQRFTPLVQAAADAALALVVVWASFHMMWSRTTMRSQYVLRVILPRLLLAVVLINFTNSAIQMAIDGNNALCDSINAVAREQILADLVDFTNAGLFAGLQAVVLLILFCCYAVLAFAYVVRFALLVTLAILAPAAALLFVLPTTQHYAKEWASLFISSLLMQPLQLLVLALGFAMDGYSVLPVRHVFALAAVFITFKVPGALHSASTAGAKASGFAKRHITHIAHAVTKV